jgi:mono/diheme cytochrome c family protein
VKRALLLVVLIGCTPPPPIATAADADRAHVPLAELSQGRDLLLAHCGACHDVPRPGDAARDKWPALMDDMSQRAGLVGPQRHLIQQYVLAMDLAR